MVKFSGMDYKDLSPNTKKRYDSMLNRLKANDISISKAILMDSLALGKTLGVIPRKKNYTDKDIIKAVENQKRVLRQIRGTKERRENTIENVYTKTYKAGYTEKQKKELKNSLTYIAGNSFIAISDTLANIDKKLAKTQTKDKSSYVESNEVVKQALLIRKDKLAKDKEGNLIFDKDGNPITARKQFVLKKLDKEVIKNLSQNELDILTDFSP